MFSDRRQAKRLPISATALLAIIIPDQTFTPNNVRSLATDISLTGMKVRSHQMTKEDYLRLIRGVNFAKVQVELPYLEEPLELKGKVVWVEYRDRTETEPASCVMGISFDRLPPQVHARLEYVIDRLSAESYDALPKLSGLEPKKLN